MSQILSASSFAGKMQMSNDYLRVFGSQIREELVYLNNSLKQSSPKANCHWTSWWEKNKLCIKLLRCWSCFFFFLIVINNTYHDQLRYILLVVISYYWHTVDTNVDIFPSVKKRHYLNVLPILCSRILAIMFFRSPHDSYISV